MFDACEICSASDWSPVYEGAVRNGAPGRFLEVAAVARCGGCGVERLAESYCLKEEAYETDAYRESLKQKVDVAAHHALHEDQVARTLNVLWPDSPRGKTVADIGCAAGTLVDYLAGAAGRVVAIEPMAAYRESLKERGYLAYPYADDAAEDLSGQVDLAFSILVIEHARDPKAFLGGIRRLMAPDGLLLLATPNRRDILMELLSEDFPPFFYRTGHRWYFDAESLARCAELSGFAVEKTRFVHRHGLSNALLWLREKAPKGKERLAGVEPRADRLWQSYLEESGQSDCLYMRLKPA